MATLLLVAVFLTAGFAGFSHYRTHDLITPAILLSGLFWLCASVAPLWLEDANMVSGLANGVAAAFATYAGLCALPTTP